MQRHLKVKQVFNGKGPFGTEDERNDWQMAGPTGPRTLRRSKKIMRPPFAKRAPDEDSK